MPDSHKKKPTWLAIVLLLIILPVVGVMNLTVVKSAHAANRLELPDGVYYHRFASSDEGPEATWINPATLGISKEITLQYIGEIGDSRFSSNYGFNITGDYIGIGFRHLNDVDSEEYDEYTFATGSEFGYRLYWGGSYRYIKNGPAGLHKKHLWNFGFVVKQNPRLSFAAVFSNLNRSRVDGRRSDIEQLYSLSYRSLNELLVASVEISLSTGQSLSSAEYNYGLDIYPLEGLMIYSNYTGGGSFEVGFRVNLLNYFVGSQSRFKSNRDHSGTSLFVGYALGDQKSLIRRRAKGGDTSGFF